MEPFFNFRADMTTSFFRLFFIHVEGVYLVASVVFVLQSGQLIVLEPRDVLRCEAPSDPDAGYEFRARQFVRVDDAERSIDITLKYRISGRRFTQVIFPELALPLPNEVFAETNAIFVVMHSGYVRDIQGETSFWGRESVGGFDEDLHEICWQ